MNKGNDNSNYQNLTQLNRKLKDKVFLYTFSDKNNLAEFCNEYHLLDRTVSSDEIKILESGSILLKTFKSDIVFSVDGELITGIEAMSSFKSTDILRISLYIWQQIISYFLRKPELLYGKKKDLKIPKVVCFVLYTGSRKLKSQYSLREEFFNNNPEAPDAIIKIIKPNNNIIGSVSNQYMRFCVYETEFLKNNKTGLTFKKQEISKFLNRMIDLGILPQILIDHRNEVVEMIYLFNDFQNYLDNEIKESIAKGEAKGEAIGIAKGEAIGIAKGEAKGEAIGIAKGEAIGIAKGEAIGIAKSRKEMIESLLENGIDIPTIAHYLKMSPTEIKQALAYK